MKNNKLKTGGFTLIEMLVALGVFTVVMTIAMAAFVNIMDIQKKTETFRKVNDNLNFALEAMMREIREGKGYSSGSGVNTFSFTNKYNKTVTYKLNIEKYIERKEDAKTLRMTSTDVKITKLNFSVRGETMTDQKQPIVIISVSGESGIREKSKSSFNLQTTVSQRQLDSL